VSIATTPTVSISVRVRRPINHQQQLVRTATHQGLALVLGVRLAQMRRDRLIRRPNTAILALAQVLPHVEAHFRLHGDRGVSDARAETAFRHLPRRQLRRLVSLGGWEIDWPASVTDIVNLGFTELSPVSN
jgi:hypothetical protein